MPEGTEASTAMATAGPTSENAIRAKFAEFDFHALG
jgi:hypothetical protein